MHTHATEEACAIMKKLYLDKSGLTYLDKTYLNNSAKTQLMVYMKPFIRSLHTLPAFEKEGCEEI